MAKFLVLYNSAVTAQQRMANSTPEQMQAGMKAWIDWKDQLPANLKFEFGMPLQMSEHLGSGTANDQVGGYSTMEGDKAAVAEQLKGHPHLKEDGNSIDVLEMLSMPGMEG